MRLTTAVITSTIGRPCLKEAIISVAKQTRHARHYIFVDGPQYYEAAEKVLSEIPKQYRLDDTVLVYLPNNTGKNMYTCSHINAMAPYMATEDMILFLDDDNWYEDNHVETVVGMVERHNLDWGCSLRNIATDAGKIFCKDECESLAMIPNHAQQNHVDTSCMALRRDVAQKIAPFWIVQKWMDRSAFKALIDAKLFGGCTGKFTMNYRISNDGLGNMPINNFKELNKLLVHHYPDAPWRKKLLFQFNQ